MALAELYAEAACMSEQEKRIDEALRMFLETFRLSGEAAVISYVLEGFAESYQVCGGNEHVRI